MLKREPMTQFIVVWSLLGFPLLALMTTALGLPSTIFSVVLRTFVASAALLLIAWNARPADRVSVVLFLMFWFFYFARLAFTTALDLESLARPMSYYWIWSTGACFLPSLALLLRSNSAVGERLQIPLLLVAVAALLLAYFFGSSGVRQLDYTIVDHGRLNVESLNPISMGHLGVSGILLGICTMLTGGVRGRMTTLAVMAIIFGVIIAMLANSRGPLLALGLCLLMMAFAGAHRRRTYTFGLLFLTLLVIVAFYQQGAIFDQAGIWWRFQAFFMGVDLSGISRMNSFEGAFTQFLQSPILGNAIEERTTGFYPHNVVLEALMATGIAGGLPFLALILYALSRSWRLVRQGSTHMWIGVLSTQYIVAGMFSGAIYSSNTMWVLIALTLSLPTNQTNENGVARRFRILQLNPVK